MDRLLAGPALVVGRQLAADRLLAGPTLVVGRREAGPANKRSEPRFEPFPDLTTKHVKMVYSYLVFEGLNLPIGTI